MIVSVHIHKNGGMSFKNFLLKSFGEELFLEYGKDNAVLERFFSGGENEKPKVEEYKSYKIVHGHFLANRFDNFDGIELITFLRDPAQRVVSNYYFYKRNFYDHSPICHMIRDGMTLEEYVEHDSSRNAQTFFLANKPIDDFKFIGILEEYEESIKLMRKILNIKFNLSNQLFYYKRYFGYMLNGSKSKNMSFDKFSSNRNNNISEEGYNISPLLLEKIKENNRLDYKNYENARIRFYDLRKEYNV